MSLESSIKLQPAEIFQDSKISSNVTNSNTPSSNKRKTKRKTSPKKTSSKRKTKGDYSEIVIGIFGHGSIKNFENNNKKKEFLKLSSKMNYYNPFPITGCPLYSSYKDRFYAIHTLKKHYSYRKNKKNKTKKAHLDILKKFKRDENYLHNQGIYYSQANADKVDYFHPDKKLHTKMLKISQQMYDKNDLDPKKIQIQKQFSGDIFLQIIQDKDFDLRRDGDNFKADFAGIYVFHHTGGKLDRYYRPKLMYVDDDYDGEFSKKNPVLTINSFGDDTSLFEIMKSLHKHYNKVYIYDFSCNSYFNTFDNYPTRKKAIQNPLVHVKKDTTNNSSNLNRSLYTDEYTEIPSI